MFEFPILIFIAIVFILILPFIIIFGVMEIAQFFLGGSY